MLSTTLFNNNNNLYFQNYEYFRDVLATIVLIVLTMKNILLIIGSIIICVDFYNTNRLSLYSHKLTLTR